jgi:cytidine deaminase
MNGSKISRRGAVSALGFASIGLFAHKLYGESAQQRLETRPFSDASFNELRKLKNDPGFAGVIPAANVNALSEREHWNVQQVMMALLPLASSLSHAPISNFHVGAAALGGSGNVYLGANLEISAQWLGATVHAEQSAIANAYMHAQDSVTAIAVNYAPCGHCRQFINELSLSGDIDVLVANQPPTRLSLLLPSPFGPKDLNAKRAALPPMRVARFKLQETASPLSTAALEAARSSYAPYSQSLSGVAIETGIKTIFKGSYIENAAFNPSLSPLQVALVAMAAQNHDFSDIRNVVLVESASARISQKNVTQAVLSAVAPIARLRVALATG